jgi:hypothetical protein
MEENTLKQHSNLLEKWLQDLRYLEGRAPSTLVTYRRFVGKFLSSVQHDPILQADVDDFVRSLMEENFNRPDERDEVLRVIERMYRLGYNERAYIKAERALASKERGSQFWGMLRRSPLRVWTFIKKLPLLLQLIISLAGAVTALSTIYVAVKWMWKYFSH